MTGTRLTGILWLSFDGFDTPLISVDHYQAFKKLLKEIDDQNRKT